ncbi:MAG TPA: cytochrome c oxidase subunit II [Terriglobales bacterium]|jgi:cytochrome c oxidase subunit 2|nr:cytochrome c oxidase subunit II [Terriglobales bacterium]
MRIARAAAYATLLIAAGCQSNHSMLRSSASRQAANIEWLYWFIFWISLVVFVLVISFFARGSARSQVDDEEMAPVLPQDEERDRGAKAGVAVAIGITVVTLFVVLALSVVTGKTTAGLTSQNPITIQVIGHQWWWEFRYPNPQADLTVSTANEVHLPVGKPIVVLTTSRDVIHSFWLPNVDGKRDLLPGYQSAFTFQVDKPGIYHGQCAEFCGEQHAHMGFEMVAEPMDEFQQWLQQQRKSATDPQDITTVRGREVFLTHACVLCHTVRGTDAGSKVGPDLTHLASRRMLAAATLSNAPGSLAGWITDPQRLKPGARMPANPLQPDDLQALVTYLRSLQ